MEDLWAPYQSMGVDFARHAEDSAYNAHYDRPAVLAALGPVRGLRLLDAGCGPGLYVAELLRAGALVTGFDASPLMVDLARQRVGEAAQIDLALLGEPLPYPDEAFDLAVCALTIHHVQDRATAFAELHRVLLPGGRLVVSTTHPTADWLRVGGSYFDQALETEVWGSALGDHEVSWWREPLSDLCRAAFSAGFVLDDLVEPKPVDSMRDRYPEEYEKLQHEPGFLVLGLRKTGL